jgi:hypothetical protein
MSSELEAAAADSFGGFFRRKTRHSLPIGSPCPNCATILEGPWCHACGQRAEDYHRSIVKLGAEAIEGFFELDGRLFRTLPKLILRPGALTNDYLEGHRVPQIPPFRLFLVVVLLVFFAGALGQTTNPGGKNKDAVAAKIKDDVKRDLAKDGVHISAPGVSVTPDNGARVTQNGNGSVSIQAPGISIITDETPSGAKAKSGSTRTSKASDPTSKDLDQSPFGRWLNEQGRLIYANQDLFKASVDTWGHRLAILALPMSAAILGLMFIWRRKFYIFDHLIFSMHSLSFQGLLFTTGALLNYLFKTQFWWVLVLVAPVHLYKHMRKVYGRGRIMTLVRMFILFIASCVGATLIMLLVVVMGAIDVGNKARGKPAPSIEKSVTAQPDASGPAGLGTRTPSDSAATSAPPTVTPKPKPPSKPAAPTPAKSTAKP